MKKVILVFGTRPEAIKMCPLVKELKARQNLETIVCVTGQHRQMLDQVLQAFEHMYKHLCEVGQSDKSEYAMAGYILNNTLTDHGHVTRGVCQIKEGYLAEIVERKQIERQDGVVRYFDQDKWVDVAPDRLVSMNMWALTPDVFAQLEKDLVDFLECEVPLDVEKSECLIPTTIGELIEKGEAKVKMYASHDTWQGVTYKEDKLGVMATLAKLKEEGLYPNKLFDLSGDCHYTI